VDKPRPPNLAFYFLLRIAAERGGGSRNNMLAMMIVRNQGKNAVPGSFYSTSKQALCHTDVINHDFA